MTEDNSPRPIMVVGAGPGLGHLASRRLLEALDEGHIILFDDAEAIPEFDMQHVVKLFPRDEYKPLVIKYNHAQEHGDTWRRKGKRKGRRGR